jgi:hypothetical protein
MCLVQEDQAVMRRKTRKDGSCEVASTVTTKQNTRSELIDRGGDHGRLRWKTRPTVISQHTAPQTGNPERPLRTADQSQPISDRFERTLNGFGKPASHTQGSVERLINDDPTIHDEPDPAWRCALCNLPFRL